MLCNHHIFSNVPIIIFKGIFGFNTGVIFFGIFQLWIVPYLMTKFKYSREFASIISGIALLSTGVSSIVCGELSRRTERRKIFCVLGSIFCASFVLFIYIPSMPTFIVILLNIITGIAGGCFPMIFTLTREYNWYYGNAETATGFVNTIMLCSAFFGQYTIGALLDLKWEERDDSNINELDGNRIYTVDDYNFAMILVPICLSIAIVTSLFFKETYGINIDYGDKDNKQNENKRTNDTESELTTFNTESEMI